MNEFKIKNGYLSEGNSQITGSLNVSAGITGSLLGTASYVYGTVSGSLTNITEITGAVSGTIPATGTTTITLNLNSANYFVVSASTTGTVSWVVTNIPPTNQSQTFVLEYTNGGIKTNTWFTNTRWPAGSARSATRAQRVVHRRPGTQLFLDDSGRAGSPPSRGRTAEGVDSARQPQHSRLGVLEIAAPRD